MDDWWEWALWMALGFNLVAGAWNLVAAIRHDRKAARLDRETYGARPLLPADKAAALRPGDTVLMLFHDHWYGNDVVMGSIKEQVKALNARGVEAFFVSESFLQNAVVLADLGLKKGGVGSDGGKQERP